MTVAKKNLGTPVGKQPNYSVGKIDAEVPDDLRFQVYQFDPNIRRPYVNRGAPKALVSLLGDKSIKWRLKQAFEKIKTILKG